MLLPRSRGSIVRTVSTQLFGLFDDGFADLHIAITRVVRMLTAPPPEDQTETEHYLTASVSSTLMYYW